MYEALKVLHILAFTSWMAGLFYLPRIFVYHAERAGVDTATSETFKVMERKLFKYIMTPSMVVTWFSGAYLAFITSALTSFEIWFLSKVILVGIMTFFHAKCGHWSGEFSKDSNKRSGRFFRIANEAPTLLFIGIVCLVILRPF